MEEKIKRICHYCGGLGKEGGCPKCGETPKNKITKALSGVNISADIIPVHYQGKIWEPPVEEGLSDKFRKFDDSLRKVLDVFLTGKIPAFSMFIAAPIKYGKQEFAYSCMQAAIAQKHSVAPLLSTSDWRRVYRISQVNPFYKLYGKYQWDTLIMYDVVFISIDHSEDRYDSIGLIKDIFDSRCRFNKVTFILSDFNLESLAQRWGEDDYNLIFNSRPDRDYARYPVITQRF